MTDTLNLKNNDFQLFNVRNFVINTLLLTATAAVAQEQQITQTNSDDTKDRMTLVLDAANIAGLTVEEGKTTFYNDFAPSFLARAENKRGDYAQLSGQEGVIYNNDSFKSLTIKFMVELGKQLGNGGVITFKTGRAATEAGAVFDNPLSYYADAYDIGRFGNASDRIVFGYEKGGQFIELGMIGSAGDGFYVIPNPNKSDFWAKCGLTLLEKSGVRLDMTAAVRTGSKHRQLLSSIGIHSRAYGGTIFGHYDAKQHCGNLGARAWYDLRRGWKTIAESVITQNRDLSVRAGVGKGGMQFSLEISKPREQPVAVNFTVASNLARSHTICGHK
ncbi:MAG: hypothetical protein IJS88_03750 [Alphaproteobacteria bacterium]|nr:hypothetical protein [Alphaproteobacteria bacterium]